MGKRKISNAKILGIVNIALIPKPIQVFFFLFPLETAAMAFPVRTRVFCSTRVWEYLFHYPVSHNVQYQGSRIWDTSWHHGGASIASMLCVWGNHRRHLFVTASGKLCFCVSWSLPLNLLEFSSPTSIKKGLRKQFFGKNLSFVLTQLLAKFICCLFGNVLWSQSE